MNTLIRRTIIAWEIWRGKRRIFRSVPGYASAARQERQAIKRGCTQAIHRARIEKRQAVNMALRGRAV